jgi:hypothetical protein
LRNFGFGRAVLMIDHRIIPIDGDGEVAERDDPLGGAVPQTNGVDQPGAFGPTR